MTGLHIFLRVCSLTACCVRGLEYSCVTPQSNEYFDRGRTDDNELCIIVAAELAYRYSTILT